MKKLFIVFLTIIFLAGCSTESPRGQDNSGGTDNTENQDVSIGLSTGDTVRVTGENNDFTLHSIDFLDENNGWIIQSRWNSSLNKINSQLLITHNSGTNWFEVGSDSESLVIVKFVDQKEGWAISEVNDGTGSNSGAADNKMRHNILHTIDGGIHWDIQWEGEQISTSEFDLWFQDNTFGFALVGSTLIATQNGGKQWSSVSFSDDNFTPQHMSFTDAKTGWVVGISGQDNVILSVLHTIDGGKSWRRQFYKDYAGSGPMGSIGINFIDEDTGWFLTSDMNTWKGELYYTDDAGADWEMINKVGCARPYPTGMEFISEQVGWIPLDAGAGPIEGGLEYTRDGGNSFHILGINDKGSYGTQKISSAKELDFITEQQGWVIGRSMNNGDYLIRTNDGGNTWDQVYPNLIPTKDISFVNDQIGFGLGVPSDPGALLSTEDGGNSWQMVKSFSQEYSPQKISFIDANTGWVFDTSANPMPVILHTTDGGKTWTKLGNLPEYTSLDYFQFFNAENGIIVSAGQNDTLYRTVDGGETWEVFSTKEVPEPGIRQFAFISLNEGWKIHCPQNKNINISHTTDGTVWQNPSEVASDALANAFTFLTDQEGMILVEEPPFQSESRMKLLVTKDAGKTWEEHLLPEGINGDTIVIMHHQRPMQFIDKSHGWILSSYGLLATQDGGKTWTWE